MLGQLMGTETNNDGRCDLSRVRSMQQILFENNELFVWKRHTFSHVQVTLPTKIQLAT